MATPRTPHIPAPAPRQAAGPDAAALKATKLPRSPHIPSGSMIGKTGLWQQGGYIFDEWDVELQGTRGRRNFREMADQDGVVGAFLYAIEMLCRQVSWRVVPAEIPEDQRSADGAEPTAREQAAQEVADFVESALHDMEETWPDTLAEILTCLVYGWSLHELVYKTRDGRSDNPETNSRYSDGKVGWRSWAVRSQETLHHWEFADDQNTVVGMWQMPPPAFEIVLIPMSKALLFRPTVRRGNPEGRSLLRNAYRDYYFKKRIESIEAIGIERELCGVPEVLLPSEVLAGDDADSVAARATYTALVTNLRVDDQHGVLMPSDRDEHGDLLYELKLITSGGQRQIGIDTVVQRKNTSMAQSVLADFMMLGHNQRGSQSLGSTKVELFNTALAAILDMIAAVPNDKAIPDLVALNGYDEELCPHLDHGEIERTDLVAIAQLLLALAQAGADIDLSRNSPILEFLQEETRLPFTEGAIDAGDEGDVPEEQGQQDQQHGQPAPQPKPAQPAGPQRTRKAAKPATRPTKARTT